MNIKVNSQVCNVAQVWPEVGNLNPFERVHKSHSITQIVFMTTLTQTSSSQTEISTFTWIRNQKHKSLYEIKSFHFRKGTISSSDQNTAIDRERFKQIILLHLMIFVRVCIWNVVIVSAIKNLAHRWPVSTCSLRPHICYNELWLPGGKREGKEKWNLIIYES